MDVKVSDFTIDKKDMKFMLLNKSNLFVFLLLAGILTSCINTKKAIYFPEVGNTIIPASTVPVAPDVIQKNDLLNINVSSLDKDNTIFNAPNLLVTTGNNTLLGYLVADDGTIQFPILGNIKADGLTKEQLRLNIQKRLQDEQLLKGPIVTVRLLNFRVTVLGEVKNPTTIDVPSEKISLLQAIGLAGDLTIYARRDNVAVVRQKPDGSREITRINLNSAELLSSPYYYLKSNDVVYVEPNKSKVASTGRGQQWVPAVLSGLSLIAIFADRLIK
ncbi:MAG TPA: polysaccharide biosynthesis/export family protein [Chitinophagaceae bacterium]|jgi:polysaccharide export outer membrane protein